MVCGFYGSSAAELTQFDALRKGKMNFEGWQLSGLIEPLQVSRKVLQSPHLGLLELLPTDNKPLIGFQFDLNSDEVDDLFVTTRAVCGAQNCLYILFDGKTEIPLGTVGGSGIYILKRRINGFRIIQTWWHGGGGTGTFSTYVYDGEAYTIVSTVHVEGVSIEKLFEKLNTLPKVTNEKVSQ